MISYRSALQGALVLAKSGRLELRHNTLRTLEVYLQSQLHNRPAKLSNLVKKRKIRAITPFKVIQGHRGRCQSKARMRLSIRPID